MKQKLSCYLMLLLGLFAVTGMRAQSLAAGDIAFIGYNFSGSDGFSIIALKDLPAGETLYFTEEGWSATGWNNEFEPHLSWVIPAGTTIGTIVSVVETAPNTFTVTGSSNGVTLLNPTGSAVNFNLLGGDQILAYQSTSGARPVAPTFISGVHGDYNSTNYNSTTTWNDLMPLNAGSESIVPSGLTNGVNCVSLFPDPGPEVGYNKYTGTLTGTASTVRAAINNPANWTNSGSTDLGILPSNYSGINITPDAPACSLTVYNVTGGGSFCQGGSGVFIGLADSDVGVSYQLYLGANPSGSPVVGTGNNISFGTRTTAGTYTVVASDGGSCQEDMNGSASITVNPLPTITLGTSPTVPQGSTSANLPYTATTNSPVTYTITWSATALAAGFTNISTPQPLPASPIVITVPATAPTNTYVAAVRVQTATCNSTSTIFTVTVANPNSAPTFVGGATQALSLCENSTAVSINNLLQVNDTNNGQTLTWSVTSAASNGTVAASYSTSSNGGQVTPVGLTYTPNANYTGNDSFTVQVSDGFATASTTVNVTVSGVDASISSQTNIACNGGATGALTVTATNGAAPYTYLWSNGATAASINGLAAGTYTVTVTDANSCTATASATLTEPTTALSGTTVVTNIACNGGNTGAINLTPTGGTAPYTFDWGGGITTEDRTGLTAGTYSVTITDANGCTGTVSATVTEPTAAVSGTTVVTNVACNGGNTGAINLTPTGGTGPYTFDWGGGITTEDRTGLSAGTYSVTITDANGCTGTVSATVTEPTSAVSGTTVVTNVACNGGNTGAINLTPTGGTAPYTFDWGGGVTTEDRTGLSAGTYSVTITDANGCTGTASATVIEPTTAVSGTTVVTNVACNGGNTGAINLTPTGGTAPYTFDWGVGVTTEDRTGLSAGTYSVTITDANGCTGTVSATVTQPTALNASAVVDNNATCANNDGEATVSVTGGTAGYTYLWSNGAITASVTGLAAGTYSVTVTDANGCTATDSVTITAPPAPSVSVTSQVNVACNGGSNGSADITVTGGTAPYTFVWSNSAVTEDLTGLSAGTYTVTVTDANGCTGTASVTITEPTVLSAAGVATNVSCNGGSNGTVDLTVTGGTGT
ncbi:cadherin-like domain-containing protein, partial [Flavobacterium sp. D11R37]|uniref:beta strand repeat-containing protein n=1 Tax=Flavobacterium coralii TaxID=2838017 RepID=UPI001CA76B03